MSSAEGAAAERVVPGWSPSTRELDDPEVLLLGGYAPLRGFLGPHDIAAVAQRGRLSDGTAWPVAITLVVPPAIGESAARAGALELLDEEGAPIAEVVAERVWPAAGGLGIAGAVRALRALGSRSYRALQRPAPAHLTGGQVLGVPIRGPIDVPQLAALRACAATLGTRILFLPLTGQAQHARHRLLWPGTRVCRRA